jgi:hypothetical protein
LAGLVVRPLLEPARAARLTLPRGAGALDLDALLRQLLDGTWEAARPADSRRAALQRVAQRVVLDAMMDLCAHKDASPEVRATTMRRLSLLRGRLDEMWRRPGIEAAHKAHAWLASTELGEFIDHPETRRTRPTPLPAPPGRPIGAAREATETP